MTRCVHVIADDLTGAADAGVAFRRRGRSVLLVLRGGFNGAATAVHRDGAVSVVDTDSREVPPGQARTAVTAATRGVGTGCVVLKKVDSLMRGNVTDEVAAIRSALPDRLVVVAPALPALGRQTRDGVPYVAGLPLRASDAWRGEVETAPHHVEDLIPGAHVDVTHVRQGRDGLAARLSELAAAGVAALCDVETASDLSAIVRAGLATGGDALWVGSAGLARALADELRPDEDTDPPIPLATPGAPNVAILGSTSAVAHSQARALSDAGARWFALPSDDLIRAPEVLAESISAPAGTDLVVTVSGEVQHDQRRAVARGLAIATGIVTAHAPSLLLSGGATARAVLTHRGVNSLALVQEIEPGVVRCVPDDDVDAEVITKAGSFGDPLSLVRMLEAQRQREVTP